MNKYTQDMLCSALAGDKEHLQPVLVVGAIRFSGVSYQHETHTSNAFDSGNRGSECSNCAEPPVEVGHPSNR
jgi:hypothetical protein